MNTAIKESREFNVIIRLFPMAAKQAQVAKINPRSKDGVRAARNRENILNMIVHLEDRLILNYGIERTDLYLLEIERG